jgi:hypothetical protein
VGAMPVLLHCLEAILSLQIHPLLLIQCFQEEAFLVEIIQGRAYLVQEAVYLEVSQQVHHYLVVGLHCLEDKMHYSNNQV